MKKYLIIIMILLFSFTINVNAEEIPESGVRYVVTSATGEKFKTFDLEEAQSKVVEELIFDGTTNDNGEVVIGNLENNSSIRIIDIQSNKEYKKVVGQDSLTVKVNRITNPKTGNNLIYIIVLLIGTISITMIVKINKKMLPLAILILTICLIPNTKAEEQTIKLVDSRGNGLSNAPIKVYATPTLSFEEVTIKLKYDLTKTEKENSGVIIEDNYATFLDGTKTKEVIYKWDYENEEWVPEDENIDLRYVYASWNNNRWINYDYCDPEFYQYDRTNQKLYYINNNSSIFFSSTGELIISNDTTNIINYTIQPWENYQEFEFPIYSTLLEDQTITIYKYYYHCVE